MSSQPLVRDLQNNERHSRRYFVDKQCDGRHVPAALWLSAFALLVQDDSVVGIPITVPLCQ